MNLEICNKSLQMCIFHRNNTKSTTLPRYRICAHCMQMWLQSKIECDACTNLATMYEWNTETLACETHHQKWKNNYFVYSRYEYAGKAANHIRHDDVLWPMLSAAINTQFIRDELLETVGRKHDIILRNKCHLQMEEIFYHPDNLDYCREVGLIRGF